MVFAIGMNNSSVYDRRSIVHVGIGCVLSLFVTGELSKAGLIQTLTSCVAALPGVFTVSEQLLQLKFS